MESRTLGKRQYKITPDTMIGRAEVFRGNLDNSAFRSNRRVFREALFVVVKKGSEAQMKAFLANERMNVLSICNGQNVMQAFCESVDLPADRYLDKDFDPQKEVPAHRQNIYFLLDEHYKRALQEEMLALQTQKSEEKLEEVQLPLSVVKETESDFLSSLCCLPNEILKKGLLSFYQSGLLPRKIVRKYPNVRRLIVSERRKKRV